jgi:hypothetical protein
LKATELRIVRIAEPRNLHGADHVRERRSGEDWARGQRQGEADIAGTRTEAHVPELIRSRDTSERRNAAGQTWLC